jgi:hypothetical protein
LSWLRRLFGGGGGGDALDGFAATTRKVLASSKGGIAGHLPTAQFPARRHLASLSGPGQEKLDDAMLEKLVNGWIAHLREGDEECLVAYRHGRDAFKVVRLTPGGREERLFAVAGEGRA